MTAQVAVLNTQGVALASDSAVTVIGGGTSRSYPSADKIFPVQGMPIAVLHSGCAALWGVPWQLLVDMWAQHREPVQAVSVEAYAREFTTWLAGQPALVTEEAQDEFFRWTFRDYLLAVRGRIRRDLEAQGIDPAVGYVEGALADVVDGAATHYLEVLNSRPPLRGPEQVDAAALCTRLSDELDDDLAWVFDDTPRTARLDVLVKQMAALLVVRAEPFSSDAVLAFTGYGRDDYFPSLFQMTLSGAVGGVVRTYDESQAAVSSSNRVSITPLGLTDAIHAFLRGTSPQYRLAAHQVLDGYLEEDEEADGTQPAHDQLDAKFDELEWKEFLSPMLGIVETLPMLEMLRLADSLVGLASLRQLIQGQSSVGGPIDLARVTKNGGFEWVRSKKAAETGVLER